MLYIIICYISYNWFYSKQLAVKLNGGRRVVGILRGFDPFMNMVIDESIEECKDGTKNNIGMVVSCDGFLLIFMIMRIKWNSSI